MNPTFPTLLTAFGSALALAVPQSQVHIESVTESQRKSAACTAEELSTADLHFKSALSFLKSGDLDDARKELSRVDECTLTQCRGSLLLGKIAFQSGTYQEALQQFRKALACDRTSYEANLLAGKAALHLGIDMEAVERLEGAAVLRPGRAEVYALLARAYTRLHRADDSQRVKVFYDQAQKLHLGELSASQGRWQEALDYISEYLVTFPSSSDAHYLRAGALQNGFGQTAQAIDVLKKALELDPRNLDARHLLATLYWIRGEAASSKRELTIALQIDVKDSLAYYYLGRFDLEKGELISARSHLELAELYKPNDWRIATNLALVYEALHLDQLAEGKHQAALSFISMTYVSEPSAYINYGSFLLNHERNSEALVVLKQAFGMKLSSAPNGAFFLAGVAAARMGEFEQSAEFFRMVVSKSPSDINAHLALASVYDQLGDLQKARTERESAKRLSGR